MFRPLVAALLACGVACSTALADECEPSQDPSPATSEATGIDFYNDTQYAFRVLWAGEDGFLQEYGLFQPSEVARFDTYVGHRWFIELYAPEGAYCFGPVSAPGPDACQAHILFDGGIGIDAGFCDF